jgi:hypothetical protein
MKYVRISYVLLKRDCDMRFLKNFRIFLFYKSLAGAPSLPASQWDATFAN